MDFNSTLYEKKAGIATITINRPEVLNALNWDTINELLERIEAAENDDEVKVLVITGAGDRAFSSGADIRMMKELTPEQAIKLSEHGQHLMNSVEALTKPVIAEINGYALGGGCELAMVCDIRIASAKAEIGAPEVNLGVTLAWGGTQRLPRLVGKGAAKELIFTGRRIDARTAERLGLVNAVVSSGQLNAKVKEVAMELASKPAVAIKFSKALIDKSAETSLKLGLSHETEAFAMIASTEDFNEGVSAFLEKRKPKFKGK